MLNKKKTKNL